MPTVSVITPCYNGSKYLSDCIESVLSQTYDDWEMLIVDDCSTDNSVDIIREYVQKDSRIKFIKNDKASGSPAIPRNIGIDKALGRYLAFLDCDDMWLPNKLQEQLSLFNDRKCVMTFSNYEKISASGISSGRIVKAPSVVDIKQMYYGNPIGCLTVMVDTAITGKFQFKQMHHEDCVAWIDILSKYGAAYNTNIILAKYRETENSVSRNKLRILLWQWNIYRTVFNFNIFKSAYYYLLYAYNGYKKSRI